MLFTLYVELKLATLFYWIFKLKQPGQIRLCIIFLLNSRLMVEFPWCLEIFTTLLFLQGALHKIAQPVKKPGKLNIFMQSGASACRCGIDNSPLNDWYTWSHFCCPFYFYLTQMYVTLVEMLLISDKMKFSTTIFIYFLVNT